MATRRNGRYQRMPDSVSGYISDIVDLAQYTMTPSEKRMLRRIQRWEIGLSEVWVFTQKRPVHALMFDIASMDTTGRVLQTLTRRSGSNIDTQDYTVHEAQ